MASEIEKNLINEITDFELESLDVSSIQKQLDDWKNLYNLLESKIEPFIESFGFENVNIKHLTNSNGIINSIYLIDCSEIKDPLKTRKLVLKISNPLIILKKVKTTNEVAVINYLRKNTTIPVPDIISYSNDRETSPLNCEFILMNFIEGKHMHEVIAKNAEEIPQIIIEQFIDIFKQLKSVKVNEKKIGSFDENMKIVSMTPNIIATDNFLDYYENEMRSKIKELKKLNKYKDFANEYEKVLNKIIDIVNGNHRLNRLNFSDKLSLNHNDLHSGNILVDENTLQITGIIDWEWSDYSFDDQEFEFYKTFYSNKANKDKIQQRMSKIYEENFGISDGREIRKELRKLYDNLYFSTFYLPTYFDNSWIDKSKWTDSMDLNVRLHIDRHVQEAKEYMENIDNLFKMLSEYK